MQTAQIIPFQFEAREVRTLLIDDQPWFVAADVAAALQYREAKDMARNLDEDEKGRQIVPTLGGDQELLVINESGLYSAILRSRKPEAKRFKKWVTAEVLPAIRKHGRYEDAAGRMQTLLGATIGTDGFRCLAAVVDGKVRALPAPVRRRAKAKLWAQVHAAFSVGRAEDIPAEQLDAARNFVAGYAIEGEFLGQLTGFAGVIGRPLSPIERWMVSLDPQGRERYTPVPVDACVMTHRELIKAMVTPGALDVSTEEVFEFSMAALANLKVRSASQGMRQQQLSDRRR
ncbi:phage antirepressor protein [Pseudomonas sp. A-1]|uniref:BRO-N domain-containing protein n=1 Tax=Pseudomonas sp. A-1 TaxID=1821274 RepID=UPI0010A5D3EC|nr:Bro-N domain-containing protein [Pseudomonas sp. A-1]THG87119.1 phage antirepressor protein [Pseudomonas sp. A-1]